MDPDARNSQFAAEHGIEVEATKEKIFSTDQNLWGRSIEAGILEDPWVEPPPETFQWTADPTDAPDEPEEVEIAFDRGRPVALNGRDLDGVALIEELNKIAGQHGVGRIDHIENRLVGIKSREIYEAPAAIVLHEAHREIEFLTLSKDALRFKTHVSQAYADLIYNGLWFSALHQDLMAFVVSNQQYVSGVARVKLFKGHCDDRRPQERASASTATSWPPTRRATSTTPRPPRASSRSTASRRRPRPSTRCSKVPAAAAWNFPASFPLLRHRRGIELAPVTAGHRCLANPARSGPECSRTSRSRPNAR